MTPAPKCERIIALLRETDDPPCVIARRVGVARSYVSMLDRQHSIRRAEEPEYWPRHPARLAAQSLADTITAYWAARGLAVRVEITKIRLANGPGTVIGAALSSDMVNGWPRGWTAPARGRTIPGAGRFGPDGIRRPGR